MLLLFFSDKSTIVEVPLLSVVASLSAPGVYAGTSAQVPLHAAVVALHAPTINTGASAQVPLLSTTVTLYAPTVGAGAYVGVPLLSAVVGMQTPLLRIGDRHISELRVRQDIDDDFAWVFGLVLHGEAEFETDTFIVDQRTNVGSSLEDRTDLPENLISDLEEEDSYVYTSL